MEWDLGVPEFSPEEYLPMDPENPGQRRREPENKERGTNGRWLADSDDEEQNRGEELAEGELANPSDEERASLEADSQNTGKEGEEQDAGQEQNVDVTLADGRKVQLNDLETAYVQSEADRKAIGEVRESYSRTAGELMQRNERLIEYLETLVPAEPDIALASSGPEEYNYRKALREKALNELRGVLEITDGMRAQAARDAKDRVDKAMVEEDRKLVTYMPDLANPTKMAEFKKSFADTAKSLGFSEEELGGIQDHRVYRAIHYAALGLKAEAAQKTGVRTTRQPRRVRNGRRVTTSGTRRARNQSAMKRLGESGALSDAMKVDFDF